MRMTKQDISDSLRAERLVMLARTAGRGLSIRRLGGGCPAGIVGTRSIGVRSRSMCPGPRGLGSWMSMAMSGVDFINNMTTLILGHRHPAVIDALREQLERGVSYPAPTPLVVEWGELMCERVPSLDKVRFVNSGTEATLNAVRAARAFRARTCWQSARAHTTGTTMRCRSA